MKTLGQICVVLLSTAMAVGAVELALRLFPIYGGPLLRPDDVRHHVHVPSIVYEEETPAHDFDTQYVKINSQGLRHDEEIPLLPEPNEYRILVLGDSFVEARQVAYADTMVRQLQERLQREAKFKGKKVRVINAGVSGYSPVLELIYLREFGLKWRPDYVIQLFCWNDVTDDNNYFTNGKVTFGPDGLPSRIANPLYGEVQSDPARGSRILELFPLARRKT